MQFAHLIVIVANLHQRYVNLSSREVWIYPAEGQRSHRNPGFPKFGCLDTGACQVIREIKTMVLLPGFCQFWRQLVLRFWFKTISSWYGVSLGFEGCMALVTVLLCAETKGRSSLVLKVLCYISSKFHVAADGRLHCCHNPSMLSRPCRRQRGTCGPGTRRHSGGH